MSKIFIHFLLNLQRYSLICSVIIIFFYNNIDLSYCYSGTDDDFSTLIKKMAIKNHNDPTLYKKALSQAVTHEEKLKIMLTDKYYECIYTNMANIHTKDDANRICGHFIKF